MMLWLFSAFPPLEKKSWVTEAADGIAVPVDGIELTVIPVTEHGDIVENSAGIECGEGLKIPKDDHRLFPSILEREEFAQRMPQVGAEHVIAVADHEDDVRPDSLHDVRPTDPVVVEDCEIKILDARAGEWGHLLESRLDPFLAKFPGVDRGIDADDPYFVALGIGRLFGSRALMIHR